MRAVDLMLAVPVFFVILFLSSVISPKISIVGVCLMIGCTQWMEVARLVRAVVMTTKEHEFVDAARTIGLADRRIIVRHLLPHTTAPVLVAITLGLAQAIIIESGLSFLGFGVQPPTPSWGAMLQDAQSYLERLSVDRRLPRPHDLPHRRVLQRARRLPRRGDEPARRAAAPRATVPGIPDCRPHAVVKYSSPARLRYLVPNKCITRGEGASDDTLTSSLAFVVLFCGDRGSAPRSPAAWSATLPGELERTAV